MLLVAVKLDVAPDLLNVTVASVRLSVAVSPRDAVDCVRLLLGLPLAVGVSAEALRVFEEVLVGADSVTDAVAVPALSLTVPRDRLGFDGDSDTGTDADAEPDSVSRVMLPVGAVTLGVLDPEGVPRDVDTDHDSVALASSSLSVSVPTVAEGPVSVALTVLDGSLVAVSAVDDGEDVGRDAVRDAVAVTSSDGDAVPVHEPVPCDRVAVDDSDGESVAVIADPVADSANVSDGDDACVPVGVPVRIDPDGLAVSIEKDSDAESEPVRGCDCVKDSIPDADDDQLPVTTVRDTDGVCFE
jgi:hypothetical protein